MQIMNLGTSFFFLITFIHIGIIFLWLTKVAVKLLLTNPEQTTELAHYIFFMAKFDTNYDIRDKARLIRFLLPQSNVWKQRALSLNNYIYIRRDIKER